MFCRYPAYHQISPYSVAAASSFQRMAMKSTPGLASFQGSIFGSAELTNAAASLTARYISHLARADLHLFCENCVALQTACAGSATCSGRHPIGRLGCSAVMRRRWRRGWQLGSCCCSPSMRIGSAQCGWAASTMPPQAPLEEVHYCLSSQSLCWRCLKLNPVHYLGVLWLH